MSKTIFSDIPQHVAIIPDGNRRWAKARGLKPWQGHIEGVKRMEEAIYTALDFGIPYMTLWGGSYDNLTKRSAREILVLDRIYRQLADKVLNDKRTYEDEVRVRVLGEWPNLLKKETVGKLREAEHRTKEYSKNNITILIGYNGDREMLQAIKRILKDSPTSITNKTIKSNLWTFDLPPVDLIIRTANEPHLSAGFMMWDTQYSELYFSKKMWPDFDKAEFKKALDFFDGRERRKGK